MGAEESEQLIREMRRILSWMDAVMAHMDEGVVVVEGENRSLTYCNETLAEMVGGSRIALLGQPIEQVIELADDQGRPLPPKAYLPDPHADKPYSVTKHCTARLPRGDREMEVVAVPFGPEQQIVIFRDRTEKIRYLEGLALAREHALRLAEVELAQMAAIVGSSNDAIIGVNPHGAVETWNPAAGEIFKASADEAIGKPIQRFVDMGDAAKLEQAIGRVCDGQPIEHLQTHLLNAEHGATFIDMTVSPIKDRQGRTTGASLIGRDVTKLKVIERVLQETNEQLRSKNEELNRNTDEMEQFVYSVSHDLKSPLVTIKGFLGLLKADIERGETERVPRFVSRIEVAANNMISSVDGLLTLSRIGRVPPEPQQLDMGELVRGVVAMHEQEITDRGIKTHVDPRMPTILADRDQVIHLFENLIGNAIKHGCDLPDPVIRVGYRIEECQVLFFVKDHGGGIELRHHERIFGLFQRLNSRTEGTGVGLATVKRVAELMGGSVCVESEIGKGATFWIALPRSLLIET